MLTGAFCDELVIVMRDTRDETRVVSDAGIEVTHVVLMALHSAFFRGVPD